VRKRTDLAFPPGSIVSRPPEPGACGAPVFQAPGGHTLLEILIASTLLLTILGLITFPYLMVRNGMLKAESRSGAQSGLRTALNRMIRELSGGYQVEVSDPDSSGSNRMTVYDNEARSNYKIRYYRTAQNRLLREVTKYNGWAYDFIPGSPSVTGRELTFLFFQPLYENPFLPGTWLNYTLPVPDTSALSDQPPQSRIPPPSGTLILVRAIGYDSNDPNPLEVATSFSLRN